MERPRPYAAMGIQAWRLQAVAKTSRLVARFPLPKLS